MGLCLSQSKKNIQRDDEMHKDIEQQQPQHKQQLIKIYGIKDNKSLKNLKFQCAPLINNQFLYNKFHHDNNRPDQLNLQWQIDNILYLNNIITINLINLVPVNIWVVIGGIQKKTMTGLYLNIQNYHQCQFLTIKTTSSQTIPQKYQILLLKKLKHKQQFRVILQSVSDSKQSLNLINTYSLQSSTIKLQRQQLMWNNLAFQIQVIFNQNQQALRTNLSEIECVICNEQLSTCILIPCKHMCLCKNCLASYGKLYKMCPLCKKEFTQIVVYKDSKN